MSKLIKKVKGDKKTVLRNEQNDQRGLPDVEPSVSVGGILGNIVDRRQDIKETVAINRNLLEELETTYLPYNEKDDFYAMSKQILDNPSLGGIPERDEFGFPTGRKTGIFDPPEFDTSSLEYYRGKLEALENKRYEDFIINSRFISDSYEKERLDKDYPEVLNKYSETLMKRIDLHKMIAKLFVHGLKSREDIELSYVLRSKKN